MCKKKENIPFSAVLILIICLCVNSESNSFEYNVRSLSLSKGPQLQWLFIFLHLILLHFIAICKIIVNLRGYLSIAIGKQKASPSVPTDQ